MLLSVIVPCYNEEECINACAAQLLGKLDQLKEQYDAALEQMVINSILTGKVMRLIRDAAIVTEV